MFLQNGAQAACLCLAATLLLSAVSCKKKEADDPNASLPATQCRLLSSTENYAGGIQQTYGFYYNTANQVDSISAGGQNIFFVKFNYGPNYIARIYYGSADTLLSHDSLTINGAGQLTGYYYASAGDTTGTRYTYDASGQLTYSVMRDFYSATDSSTYTWQHGDYVQRTNNFINDVQNSYDTARAAQQADYLHYQQILAYGGAYLYATSHILTTQTTATGTQTFTYTYDAGGKVTRIDAARANSPYTLLFAYTCP